MTTTARTGGLPDPLPSAFPCRFCRRPDGDMVLDLGRQPPCESFPVIGADDVPSVPLRMWMCRGCGLAQLMEDAGEPAEQVAVVEPRAVTEQTGRTLGLLDSEGLLTPGTNVLEYGSPHAAAWRPDLERRGALPGDPGSGATFDLVLDVYGLLHEADQRLALQRRVAHLAAGGSAVFQLHSVSAAVETSNWAELRHGHYAYWTVPRLAAALGHVGLGVHRYREFPLDGGTAVVVARRDPVPDPETVDLLAADLGRAGETVSGLAGLQHDADRISGSLRQWLESERDAGRTVVGYAAASRAVPVLCRAGVDRSLLGAVGDASPAKLGRRMPGTDVPVVSPEAMLGLRPDRVLLLLPDLLAEVRRSLPQIEASGASWVVAGAQ